MDTLVDFLNWAWARHHNPLSWYIRPLFILPFCYFAYRKSVRGMVATVVGCHVQHVLVPGTGHRRPDGDHVLGSGAAMDHRAADSEQAGTGRVHGSSCRQWRWEMRCVRAF